MDFPVSLFPRLWLIVTDVVWVLMLAFALWRAPLCKLKNNQFSHLFFAACVVLFLLWNSRVGVLPALNFHLLGVTIVTLMFGWRLALLAVAVVVVGIAFYSEDGFISTGLNALVMGVLPVVLTQGLLVLCQRYLPHNFFVYVYINGFLAAGLSILLAYFVGALVLLSSDATSIGWLNYQYFPYFPLIFFSEAFLTGLVVTALVVLKPDWVCSFDDNMYLKNK